jgi:Tfp pilus assembly protein PilO
MKPQPVANRQDNRARFRVQIDRFRPTHRRSSTMFGISEILALVGAALMVVIVLVGYFYFLLPSRSKVESLSADRDRLEKELRFSREDIHRNDNTREKVEKITASLSRFEGQGLIDRNEGRRGLYEDLNQWIHKNGLRNTSGPAYAALEPLAARGASGKPVSGTANATAKWQSIYPGIAVSLTVEGQYQDIRHFVRDIEGSKQFLIINAMELERAEGSNVRLTPEVGASRPGAANTLVSLRMDLATYFQRGTDEANSEPQPKVH